MGLSSNYSAKAISGNEIKNDSTTLLNAGNVNPALANNVTLSENMSARNNYGSTLVLPVSPVSSGNTGYGKAISAGTLNQNTEGNYIAIMLGTKIAGVTSNLMRNSASDVGQRGLTPYYVGHRRLDEQSWDYVTGIVTKGNEAGVLSAASGINGQTGRAADHSNNYPGELTFMQGGAAPVQDDYNT